MRWAQTGRECLPVLQSGRAVDAVLRAGLSICIHQHRPEIGTDFGAGIHWLSSVRGGIVSKLIHWIGAKARV